ncbi:nuclear speckle splicing regulatory protein [Salix suchowensis]|nr:nuclear speckle splicing regulatory protein [Salix suchowensis]
MKKYGLLLRQPQQKKPPRPPLPTALGFGEEEEDDVEKEISRQAAKKKSLKDIEDTHKKALEEDPSVFDYDGVYDEMKQKIAQPKALDRQKRESKYIKTLMGKAEERKRQHDVIFEKNLAKERIKDDHLFADKDKFQEKWMEEERLRELREEKEDVTKKSDLSDFYFNLGKNVALGAKDLLAKKQEKQDKQTEFKKPDDKVAGETSARNDALTDSKFALDSSSVKEAHQKETSPPSSEPLDPEPVSNKPISGTNQDALAAAKERFLARKKAKQL